MSNENEKFKSYTKEWLLTTTIIGVSNIKRTEYKLVKALWIVSLLACVAVCSKIIIDLFIKYFSYNVNVSLKIRSTSTQDFPAVTFCNLNPFDQTKSNGLIKEILIKNNLNESVNPQLIKSLIKSKIAGKNTDRSQFGFSIQTMLLSCLFIDKICNYSDFVQIYDFDYINCYTFNSGFNQTGDQVPILKVNEAGTDRSFRLELYIGIDQYNLTKYVSNNGIRIVVHNQSVNPIISSDGFDITTGFQNNIGIKKSFHFKLASPYSNCIKNIRSKDSFKSNYYKAIFTKLNMSTYQQKICTRLCLQDFIRTKCYCLDGSLPNIYENVFICQSIKEIECMIDARSDYYNTESSCSQCPPECESIHYSTTLSYSRYPTQYYLDYLKSKTNILTKINEYENEGNISKSTLIANIFYDELDYTVVEQVPSITFDYLIGSVGGNLGLFIGVSVLSIGEVIEFLIQASIFMLKKISFSTKKISKRSIYASERV